MKRIETVILENLLYNEEYTRKVLPFLKAEYFTDPNEKTVFNSISDFVGKYSALPSKEAVGIVIKESKILTEEQFKKCREIVEALSDERQNQQWLTDETEKFCKDKSLYNAVLESIHIIEGKSKSKTPAALPDILSKALAVSFDTHIGHDYIEDADSRYDFYHKKESRLPFDLEYFNNITNGGVPQKTLNIILAGTGVGKSLFMCHHAANCLSLGKNVLYITCEMAEERIAERIDANLMDTTLDDLKALPKDMYEKKMERIREKTQGKLIIKEYPTASANVNHFRILLEELKLKKRFKPDVIFIDYLNICASARIKMNASVGSYSYIKSIAEELRGLAVEQGVPIFSATQTNRTGFTNTDVGLEDTSESFGLPATADFMFALITTEEMDKLGQVLVKQLKNRYNDTANNKRFVVGINRAKMKLFDVEESAQTDIVNTTPAPAKPKFKPFGGGSEGKFKKPEIETKFKGWKV
jgi:replicative DNA helicase